MIDPDDLPGFLFEPPQQPTGSDPDFEESLHGRDLFDQEFQVISDRKDVSSQAIPFSSMLVEKILALLTAPVQRVHDHRVVCSH